MPAIVFLRPRSESFPRRTRRAGVQFPPPSEFPGRPLQLRRTRKSGGGLGGSSRLRSPSTSRECSSRKTNGQGSQFIKPIHPAGSQGAKWGTRPSGEGNTLTARIGGTEEVIFPLGK